MPGFRGRADQATTETTTNARVMTTPLAAHAPNIVLQFIIFILSQNLYIMAIYIGLLHVRWCFHARHSRAINPKTL